MVPQWKVYMGHWVSSPQPCPNWLNENYSWLVRMPWLHLSLLPPGPHLQTHLQTVRNLGSDTPDWHCASPAGEEGCAIPAGEIEPETAELLEILTVPLMQQWMKWLIYVSCPNHWVRVCSVSICWSTLSWSRTRLKSYHFRVFPFGLGPMGADVQAQPLWTPHEL